MSVSSLAEYLSWFGRVWGKAGILLSNHLHYAVCTSYMPSFLVYKPLGPPDVLEGHDDGSDSALPMPRSTCRSTCRSTWRHIPSLPNS